MRWLYVAAGTAVAAGVGYAVCRRAASRIIASSHRCVHTHAQHKGLRENWEQEMDSCFSRMVDPKGGTAMPVPGVVVMARRGATMYHKAFGFADREQGQPMTTDAQMRCFSMTKVMTSTVALMLMEKGVMRLDEDVASFIPSFGREWQVCSEGQPGDTTVPYESFLTGDTVHVPYRLAPAQETMKIKHLMSECSGLGYEQWTDYQMFDGTPLGMHYGAAAALRKQRCEKGYFSSTQIIGQDCTLEEYCDALAESGVLVCEPGTFSYGLGALALGRAIEVAYERHTGTRAALSAIMEEMLWAPLGMDSAAFFLGDGDARTPLVPQLYGALSEPHGGPVEVKPYDRCLPDTQYVNTCTTDQYHGPRKCESGDTGACMKVSDYAKFYDWLLRRGVTEQGERLLSVSSIDALLNRQLSGLTVDNPLAHWMGLAGDASPKPHSFNFGWATSHPEACIADISEADAPRQCFWSGYANNHGVLYPDEASYILIFPQLMGSSTGGYLHGNEVIKMAARRTFLATWS